MTNVIIPSSPSCKNNKSIMYVARTTTSTAVVTLLLLTIYVEDTTGLFLHPRCDNNHHHNHLVIPAFRRGISEQRSSSSALQVGGIGWDNEDFLESLGKGSEAISEANEQYRRISRFQPDKNEDEEDDDSEISIKPLPGASGLSPEQIERIKRQNEEDNGGGEMFKKLLERAEKQQQQQPTYETPPPPASAPASTGSGAVLPDNFASLSVEQQAALFRELMFKPAEGNVQTFPPPPGIRPEAKGEATVSKDGRRIGRNRDADAIVNTSDVYLAQLKVDSASRNRARYSGDDDTANQVFQDPRIANIKLHINPYLEEQKKKERELYGGSVEGMLQEMASSLDDPRNNLPTSYSGIKYKDKLTAKRKGSVGTSSPATTVVSSDPRPQPTAAADTIQSAPASQQSSPPASSPTTTTTTTSTPKVVAAAVQEAPVVSNTWPEQLQRTETKSSSAVESFDRSTVPMATVTDTSSAASSTTAPTTPDEFRRDLRALMGLLLKHRGGPGFGVGRIVGAEMQRFLQLSDAIVSSLRQEEPNVVASSSTIPQQQPDVTQQAKFTPIPLPQTTIPSLAAGASGGAIAQTPRVPVGDRLTSMIACLEGAIQMYKFSPPELQEGVFITLRAALLSAVGTCNDVMSDDTSSGNIALSTSSVQQGSAPTLGGVDRLASMIGYLEGAIQMFKYSPPELQKSVLITVRAALLSAINTCNEIIAGNEVTNYDSYRSATMSSATVPGQTVPSKQYTEAEYEKDEVPKYNGNDENSQFMEMVYNRLKDAAGNGRLGLRDDLSGMEAQELADNIAEMRSMLVDELDSGIPNEDNVATGSTSSSSAAAKYQEMLAKARAAKDQQG